MAEKCTKTSSPVERCIKPYPLAPLNHFTVPFSFTDTTPFASATELQPYCIPQDERKRPHPSEDLRLHLQRASRSFALPTRLSAVAFRSKKLKPPNCSSGVSLSARHDIQ